MLTTLGIFLSAASLLQLAHSAEPALLERHAMPQVKGIYLTAYTASNQERRSKLIDVVDATELNAVVIDIKDYSGRIFFDANVALSDSINAESIRLTDITDWIQELKEKNIYTIARIAVFQDPYLAEHRPDLALKNKDGGLWRDWKTLAWVDPRNKEVWQYAVDVAKAAEKLGFDEVNFDYIRFPTDGNIDDIDYGGLLSLEDKYESMKNFYKFLDAELAFTDVYTSADLFGMVLWQEEGLTIGQRLRDAAPYFDVICPMVYPSHYPYNFEKLGNPAEHPYEIVYRSLQEGKPKIIGGRAVLRPWLQDFDIGAIYDANKIELQKNAAYDAGAEGWLLWNASNNYTVDGLKIDKT